MWYYNLLPYTLPYITQEYQVLHYYITQQYLHYPTIVVVLPYTDLSNTIFCSNFTSSDQLDLHGLHVNEAITALEEKLSSCKG